MKGNDRVPVVLGAALASWLAVSAAAQSNDLTPPLLVSTTTWATSVTLRWTNAGPALYEVFRRSGSTWSLHATVSTTTFTDNTVLANKSYYYYVRAYNAYDSEVSNIDVATTFAFGDDPIVPGQTPIRASITSELRTAVNYARIGAGLTAAAWTDPLAGISPQHIAELRTALNQALTAAGMPAKTFTDPTLVPESTLVKKVHIKELRQGVKGVQPGGVLTISNVNVSEPYFSPNGDAVRETTAVSAIVSSADASWTVDVREPGGGVVRTATGSGSVVNFTWDGRNTAGSLQPDGTYTLVLSAVDGVYTADAAQTVAVLDVTTPTATLTAPAPSHTISNIRQNGSTAMTATGSATDINLLDWNVSAGPSAESMSIFGQGTTSIASSTLGTWNPGVNGTYSVRLQVRDRAGNIATASAAVSVAHFSASQNGYQVNTANGGTVSYTSVVPFPVTMELKIRNSAGTTVRTLVNASRGAGTYQDVWNGTSDAAALLPDGAYSYIITVTEGSNVLTWDQSNQMRPPNGAPVFYPSCSSKTMTLDTCANHAAAGKTFDPWANDPLKIHYSVNEPTRVWILFTDLTETHGTCTASEVCIRNGEFRAAGDYVDSWSGVSPSGFYLPSRAKLTVIRRTDTFPKNYVVLYGSGAPVSIANVTVTPPIFSADGGRATIKFDLATFGNAPVSITLKMVRQGSATDQASVLRTVTLPATAGEFNYAWDGTADTGHRVAPGEYGLVISATTSGGSSTVATRFAVIY
jgi:flagellar hook assembly protein FlgD